MRFARIWHQPVTPEVPFVPEFAVAFRLLQLWDTPRSPWLNLAPVDQEKIGLRHLVTGGSSSCI